MIEIQKSKKITNLRVKKTVSGCFEKKKQFVHHTSSS